MKPTLLPRTDREAHFHEPWSSRLMRGAKSLPYAILKAKERNIWPLLAAFGVASAMALPVAIQQRVLAAEEVSYRQLDTMVYVANDYASPVRIPRGDLMQYLVIFLSGTLNKSGTVAGTLNPEGPGSLLTSIDITGDGDTFYTLPGDAWRGLMWYFFGRYPTAINVTSGFTKDAFSEYFIIPFESYRTVKPWDTVLRTDLFRAELTLRVKFGDETTLVNGGTYTVKTFAAPPTLRVWAIYARNPGFVPAFFTRTRRSLYGYAAAGDVRHDFLEDTTVRLVMFRMLAGLTNFTTGIAQDDIGTGGVTLETNSGVFNLRGIPGADLREDIFNHQSVVVASRAGYNFYDFAQNGLLRRSLVTRLVSNPRLTVNTAFGGAGTRQLEVV